MDAYIGKTKHILDLGQSSVEAKGSSVIETKAISMMSSVETARDTIPVIFNYQLDEHTKNNDGYPFPVSHSRRFGDLRNIHI